jgi:hypothetical protein
MKLGRALFVLLFAACGGNSPPAPQEPADHLPLPPASGTPVGYLIDGAGELHLRDDQIAQLKQIDSSLASELDVIDTRLRAASPPAQGSGSPPPQMGMGGRGGRHGGGGRHRGGNGGGSASPQPHGDPAAANRLTEERRADVKDALTRAFAVLDADQKPTAKKLLEDHDVDVDDPKPAATHASDGGDAQVPDEP